MGIKTKIILVSLVVAAFVAAGFYFGYQKYFWPLVEPAPKSITGKPVETNKPEPEKPPAPTSPVPSVMSGYKLYKNADFGFEIQHPVSWTVTEEINENVRGEMVKEFFLKKPNSDLRFAILPRDGLSYGVEAKGTSTPAFIGGFAGMQTQYILKDGRRLWLLFPQYGGLNWLQDLGRIDAMTSATDPIGDTQTFEKILDSFKLTK